MGTLASEIIKRAREDILNDPSGDRWSPETLLRYLKSGINDFVLKTGCSKSRGVIAIENNVTLYNIAQFSQKILRVEYIDTPLVVKTVAEMDAYKPTWINDTGTVPTNVIFENLPVGTFRIYPKVPSSLSSIVVQNNPYGGLIDIEIVDNLALLPNLEDIETGAIPTYLVVTYIKKHSNITIDTEIEIDTMYDDALVYFIAGMALRADKDTQNVALGTQNIGLYESYISQATGNESLNNNTLTPRQVQYRGFM